MTEFENWLNIQKRAGATVETFNSYSEFNLRRDDLERYSRSVDTYCDRGQSQYALAYPAPVCPHRMGGRPQ